MRLAHILICHSTNPRKAIESIPHQIDSLWYIFLHSGNADIESYVESVVSERSANLFPYRENRGLARSWNDALQHAMEAGCDAALLLNDDLFFYPGSYSEFRSTIAAAREISRNISFVTVNGLETGQSAHSGLVQPQNFACCAIMRETIETIGFFDENFSPAYFEDVDFARRAALAGMMVHVDHRTLVEHERSATHRSVTVVERATIDAAIDRNRAYFVTKWGSEDNPYFSHPFNDGSVSLKIQLADRRSPYSQYSK